MRGHSLCTDQFPSVKTCVSSSSSLTVLFDGVMSAQDRDPSPIHVYSQRYIWVRYSRVQAEAGRPTIRTTGVFCDSRDLAACSDKWDSIGQPDQGLSARLDSVPATAKGLGMESNCAEDSPRRCSLHCTVLPALCPPPQLSTVSLGSQGLSGLRKTSPPPHNSLAFLTRNPRSQGKASFARHVQDKNLT